MSSPLNVPGNPSPEALVRSSEDEPAAAHNNGSTPFKASSKAITPAGFALYHRAKTVPSSTAGVSGTQRTPPLSERDSIFATHYSIVDSVATTPRVLATQDSKDDIQHLPENDSVNGALSQPLLPLGPKHLPLSHKRRSSPKITSENAPHGSSLETYERSYRRSERVGNTEEPIGTRHTRGEEAASKPSEVPRTLDAYSPANKIKSLFQSRRSDARGATQYTRMSLPWEQSENAAEKKSRTAEEPSRATDGRSLSNKRNRSSSKDGVEKRIEATLANADPAPNARSRKASHYLGLFKENTASLESHKGQGRLGEGSASRGGIAAPENLMGEDLDLETKRSKDHITNLPELSQGRREESFDMQSNKDDESVGSAIPQGQQYLEYKNTNRPATSRPLSAASDRSHVEGHPLDPGRSASREEPDLRSRNKATYQHKIPLRLLEEIRSHHNLTAPFHDKFRPSRTKSDSKAEQVSVPSTEPRQRSAVGMNERSKSLVSREAVLEADEESDKEQISSALYYPHQIRSSDSSDDADSDEKGGLTGLEHSDIPIRPDALSNHEASPELQTAFGKVDIALQSDNKSRYLHGDLQKSRTVPSNDENTKPTDSGASASGSDYELWDETAQLTGDEDAATYDGETTPTATPHVRGKFLERGSSTSRRTLPPLGAVELKPYTHQVGGHTTVFRFSKRAVCKQLSNRENEFYEVIERRHPELLKFMPRYALSSTSN